MTGRRALVAGLALAGALGCGPVGPGGVPDGLLVEAMVDVQLAAERAAETGAPRDSLEALALARHGLDSAAFYGALQRRALDPAAFEALADSAIDRLTHARDR